LYREGPDLDVLLAELDAEYPGGVRVVDVSYGRDGGVMGFFARRTVGVHYTVEGMDGGDAAAFSLDDLLGGDNSAAWAAALGSATDGSAADAFATGDVGGVVGGGVGGGVGGDFAGAAPGVPFAGRSVSPAAGSLGDLLRAAEAAEASEFVAERAASSASASSRLDPARHAVRRTAAPESLAADSSVAAQTAARAAVRSAFAAPTAFGASSLADRFATTDEPAVPYAGRRYVPSARLAAAAASAFAAHAAPSAPAAPAADDAAAAGATAAGAEDAPNAEFVQMLLGLAAEKASSRNAGAHRADEPRAATDAPGAHADLTDDVPAARPVVAPAALVAPTAPVAPAPLAPLAPAATTLPGAFTAPVPPAARIVPAAPVVPTVPTVPAGPVAPVAAPTVPTSPTVPAASTAPTAVAAATETFEAMHFVPAAPLAVPPTVTPIQTVLVPSAPVVEPAPTNPASTAGTGTTGTETAEPAASTPFDTAAVAAAMGAFLESVEEAPRREARLADINAAAASLNAMIETVVVETITVPADYFERLDQQITVDPILDAAPVIDVTPISETIVDLPIAQSAPEVAEGVQAIDELVSRVRRRATGAHRVPEDESGDAVETVKDYEAIRAKFTLRRQLIDIGVPIDSIPDDAADPYRVIEQLVAALPQPPALELKPGQLMVVVGPATEALRSARDICLQLRVDPDSILAAGCPSGSVPHENVIFDRWQAATVVERVRSTSITPTVLVVATDNPGDALTEDHWVAGIVGAVSADQCWLVVDATRKPADTRALIAEIGEPHALVVADAARTASPASMWELDIPVAMIDGRPATRGAWAVLLIDKLTALGA